MDVGEEDAASMWSPEGCRCRCGGHVLAGVVGEEVAAVGIEEVAASHCFSA